MKNLPFNTQIKHPASGFISHYPVFKPKNNIFPLDILSCEKLLEEWFGLPVILLASGRSGIHLYLQQKKYNRYKHKLHVPKYLSRCVLNTLTKNVFPIENSYESHGLLLYHQYGFPQLCNPKSNLIIEDIAHSFFSTPNSGKRLWFGEVGIFSLPKFFPIKGLAGGLIVPNNNTAKKIRLALSNYPAEDTPTRKWMQKVVANSFPHQTTSSVFLDSVYELLSTFIHPNLSNLEGFPSSIDGIRQIGKIRLERVMFFKSFFKKQSIPSTFWNSKEIIIPFALPYFGKDNKNLQKTDTSLKKNGFLAGIYNVDINRNMNNPNYKQCLLLPCHQNISMKQFKTMCQIVKNNDI